MDEITSSSSTEQSAVVFEIVPNVVSFGQTWPMVSTDRNWVQLSFNLRSSRFSCTSFVQPIRLSRSGNWEPCFPWVFWYSIFLKTSCLWFIAPVKFSMVFSSCEWELMILDFFWLRLPLSSLWVIADAGCLTTSIFAISTLWLRGGLRTHKDFEIAGMFSALWMSILAAAGPSPVSWILWWIQG